MPRLIEAGLSQESETIFDKMAVECKCLFYVV